MCGVRTLGETSAANALGCGGRSDELQSSLTRMTAISVFDEPNKQPTDAVTLIPVHTIYVCILVYIYTLILFPAYSTRNFKCRTRAIFEAQTFFLHLKMNILSNLVGQESHLKHSKLFMFHLNQCHTPSQLHYYQRHFCPTHRNTLNMA